MPFQLNIDDYPLITPHGVELDLHGDTFVITREGCPWRVEYALGENEWVQLAMDEDVEMSCGACDC